jgi:hypothetical protein
MVEMDERQLKGHRFDVYDVDWCVGEVNKLASCSGDGTIRIWRLKSMEKDDEEDESSSGVTDKLITTIESQQFLRVMDEEEDIRAWEDDFSSVEDSNSNDSSNALYISEESQTQSEDLAAVEEDEQEATPNSDEELYEDFLQFYSNSLDQEVRSPPSPFSPSGPAKVPKQLTLDKFFSAGTRDSSTKLKSGLRLRQQQKTRNKQKKKASSK